MPCNQRATIIAILFVVLIISYLKFLYWYDSSDDPSVLGYSRSVLLSKLDESQKRVRQLEHILQRTKQTIISNGSGLIEDDEDDSDEEWKSYFRGFDLLNSNHSVAILTDNQRLIPLAIQKLVENHPFKTTGKWGGFDARAPPLLTNFDDWDVIPRLVSLEEVSKFPERFVISSIHPKYFKTDAFFPVGPRLPAPIYFERHTCAQMYFSEYPFIREEGYRCIRNMNYDRISGATSLGYPSSWPNDESKYHIPSIVATKNAEITYRGYLRTIDHIIIPSDACWGWHVGEDNVIARPSPNRRAVTKNVFIATVYWMDNIWHTLGETASRIAVHYDYLMKRDDILIHVASVEDDSFTIKVMNFLGIPKEKLLAGNVLAPIVLLPELPLYCGVPSYYQLNALKNLVVKRLGVHFPEILKKDFKYDDYILVIRRSKVRSITNHEEVMKSLKKIYPKEKFVEFGDNPPPSLQDSLLMFRHAKSVIAPHGAGEGNLIAARKGTKVVELLTNDNFIQVNYALMCQNLGLHYYGYAPLHGSYKGDFTVDIPSFLAIVKKANIQDNLQIE